MDKNQPQRQCKHKAHSSNRIKPLGHTSTLVNVKGPITQNRDNDLVFLQARLKPLDLASFGGEGSEAKNSLGASFQKT